MDDQFPPGFGLAEENGAIKPGSPVSSRWAMLRKLGVPALQVGGTLAAVALVTGGLLWNTLFAGMPHLPSRDELWSLNREPAIEFVDANGTTIAVRGSKYGRAVSAADLPPHVVNAFLAAEDRRFREHAGIDLKSIGRAMLANFSAGHTVQGGSTITQQLVKNLFLSQDQTIKRKAQEARLASELEHMLSKDEILDLYLNRVYFGAGSYGLDAAAHTYFGKAPEDLSLGEAALLASFPKAPSRFAKQKSEAATRARQHYVLQQMVEARYITPADEQAAEVEHLAFTEPPEDVFSGHALDYAVQRLHEVMPDLPPDVVVKLTLDLGMQQQAQAAVEKGLASMGAKHAPDGAAILLENNGAIRAMVGGRNYADSRFNRATQARRQPGSAFKMFVYAAALESGLTPSTVRNDAPLQFGRWSPKNYGNEYYGPVTLATALSRSLNTIAAQLAYEVGPKNVAELARRFGVKSPLHNYLSIALGADAVTLLDLATGYGVLAKGGLQFEPYVIDEVRNSRGDLLYSHPIAGDTRVYGQSLSESMTGMLNGVVRYGTGRSAQVPGWDVAGKTGTSQSWRDAWFIGYTSRFVSGVWVGNDDDQPMSEVTGGTLPARIFSQIMRSAIAGLEPTPLPGALPPQPPEEEDDVTTDEASELEQILADSAVAAEPTTENKPTEVAVELTSASPQ